MKIGKLIIEFRRVGGATLAEEVFNAVTDPEGDARPVIAKMARSAAKDFIDTEAGRILADVSAELEKRKAATLAELGSAAPTAAGSNSLDREVRRSVWRLEQEIRKILYTLPAELVCWNSACFTREPVPHMLDERDHRSFGDVLKAEKAAKAAAAPDATCICNPPPDPVKPTCPAATHQTREDSK